MGKEIGGGARVGPRNLIAALQYDGGFPGDGLARGSHGRGVAPGTIFILIENDPTGD